MPAISRKLLNALFDLLLCPSLDRVPDLLDNRELLLVLRADLLNLRWRLLARRLAEGEDLLGQVGPRLAVLLTDQLDRATALRMSNTSPQTPS